MALGNAGRLTYRAAMERAESRGFHLREDYPLRDDIDWLKWVFMSKETNKAYIAFPNDCMVCYLCQEMCPEDAIAMSPEEVAKLAFPY